MTGCAPAPTWEVEMFRGLRERRGDRPAVGPERKGGAPATRRVSASSEKNQEQNVSRDTEGGNHSLNGAIHRDQRDQLKSF